MSETARRKVVRASWLGKLPSEGTNLSNALAKHGQLPARLREAPLREVRSLGLPRKHWFELCSLVHIKSDGSSTKRGEGSFSWYAEQQQQQQQQEGVDEEAQSRKDQSLLGTIELANVVDLTEGVATPGIAPLEDVARRQVRRGEPTLSPFSPFSPFSFFSFFSFFFFFFFFFSFFSRAHVPSGYDSTRADVLHRAGRRG